MLRRTLSAPLPLLLLFTGLFTFLIQSGELGTADTTYRLQVTHSLWTGQPQVFPNQYPEFGLHGRGGHIYAWYGIGQSLLMLPADLVGTAAKHLPWWRNYVDTEADPAIRSIVVSISTNILVNVLTALVAFRFLELLGFASRESTVGTLSLLFATTHLHYAQNMQENNYILLLTLTGYALQLRWLQTGSRKALFWGSMALGLNLLTRLTTGLDLIAAGVFLLMVSAFSYRDRLRELSSTYLRMAVPVYAGFFFIDRVYQWIRFDSWTNTYVSIFAREERQIDPTLPVKYPFSGHFFAGGIHSGMLGPFFNPEKSVFLFDPLFALSLFVTILLWKRLSPTLRAFFVTTQLLILGYLLFYARYFAWAGDFAWGDRYVSRMGPAAAVLERVGTRSEADCDWRHGHQRGHPGRVARVLAAAGDLPGRDLRPPYVGHSAALEEHRRHGAGQAASVGDEYRGDVPGPVGRSAHHDMVFPAVVAAAYRRSTDVGRACALWGLDRRCGRDGLDRYATGSFPCWTKTGLRVPKRLKIHR
jgi:hypothetical protein